MKEKKQAGYVIGERGKPITAGVVCLCPNDFCPAHGRLDKSELKKGRRVRNPCPAEPISDSLYPERAMP